MHILDIGWIRLSIRSDNLTHQTTDLNDDGLGSGGVMRKAGYTKHTLNDDGLHSDR